MILDEVIIDRLNLAMNESKIVTCDILEKQNKIKTIVLSLMEDNKPPKDNRVKIEFAGVSKISLKLKMGQWNNESAEIIKVNSKQLFNEIKNLMEKKCMGGNLYILQIRKVNKSGKKTQVLKQ